MIRLNTVYVLMMLFSACVVKSEPREAPRPRPTFSQVVDSIRLQYASDKRLAVWSVQIKLQNDTFFLQGELSDEAAYKAIVAELRTRPQKFVNKIELLPSLTLGKEIWAVVCVPVADMHRKPARGSELLTQAVAGTPLRILKKSTDWYFVQGPDAYLGWMSSQSLQRFDTKSLAAWKQLKKVIVFANQAKGYPSPNDAVPALVYPALSILSVSDSVGIYYKTLSPRGEVVYIKKNLCVDSQFWLQHKNPSQADIATAAQRFLGTPYWWGAASTLAIDCSGFTKSVWALQGLLLQRDASQQANYGKIVATKPDILRLQVGDLLFFGQHKTDSLPQKITHVAIYLGNKQFIHASHSVRISSLDSLQQSDDRKYMKSFILARRFLGNEGKPGCQYISKNPLYSRILPSN